MEEVESSSCKSLVADLLGIRFAKELEAQEDTDSLRYIAPNIVQKRPEKEIVSMKFPKESKNMR